MHVPLVLRAKPLEAMFQLLRRDRKCLSLRKFKDRCFIATLRYNLFKIIMVRQMLLPIRSISLLITSWKTIVLRRSARATVSAPQSGIVYAASAVVDSFCNRLWNVSSHFLLMPALLSWIPQLISHQKEKRKTHFSCNKWTSRARFGAALGRLAIICSVVLIS